METKAGALFCLFVIIHFGFLKCDSYIIPEVTLTAYTPKGFSASIPDNSSISQFQFHANINESITQLDTGTVSGEADAPSAGKRTYFNPNLELKVGDIVSYWVFVQHNYLGFRQEGRKWKVTQLEELPNCRPSSTIITGINKVSCKNELMFEDEFDKIDEDNWLINQYIPYYDQDYEFVSYEKLDTVLFTRDSKLFIKPTPRTAVYGNLNLVEGCTRNNPGECEMDSDGQFLLPTIISAKLTSKFKIKYGKIEIKAKLPAGDWIFPQLHLHSENLPNHRIFIAYARGNNELLDQNGNDYGGRLLFGGPTFSYTEPSRSQYLRTNRNPDEPFTSGEHTYTVLWGEDSMQLFIDGTKYGEIMNHQFRDEAYLVIGVGVAGTNDFPNNFTSNGQMKPWSNGDTLQNRQFYLAKNQWYKTWTGDDVALQVDSIKIWAL